MNASYIKEVLAMTSQVKQNQNSRPNSQKAEEHLSVKELQQIAKKDLELLAGIHSGMNKDKLA